MMMLNYQRHTIDNSFLFNKINHTNYSYLFMKSCLNLSLFKLSNAQNVSTRERICE